MHNKTASNVTLSWNQSSLGRIDSYHVNITYPGHVSIILISYSVPSVMIEDIPYDRRVSIRIVSANCHSENEGDNFVLRFCEDNNYVLIY